MTLTNRDILRLEIGDTDVDPDSDALFSDEEIDSFLSRHSLTGTASGGDTTLLLAAASDALEALANRFSREFDFSEDGQSFQRSQRAASYRARATEVRRRAGGYSVKVVSSINAAIQDA